ncbi:MAG: DUF4864 domain-containing protein [Acidobacteria bacterium]|nr:DUF4864 domain-containing protein [Acidobacteriota bacterium]
MSAYPLEPYLLKPIPEIPPDQVVKHQVNSLKNNSKKGDDLGIAAVFMFASPSNKMFTGPLARFIKMIKNPLYAPLLDHKKAYFGPMVIDDDKAEQVVTIIDENNNSNVYVFRLSRQTKGHYRNCWMTDSVLRN